MPKRHHDSGAIKLPRKIERTHEKNQERAYIAASRRTDRSIEARVQSAQMASEIHKKRTGKALRVSEAIVMGEEMYEEEESEFPRSYRCLAPHMKTSSAEMNMRVDAYLTNRVVLSQMISDLEKNWRENEVNQAFAKTFPNAHQSLLRRWSSSGLSGPLPTQNDTRYVPQSSPYERHTLTTTTPPVLGMNADHQSPPLTLTSESGSQPGTPHSSQELAFENISSPNSPGRDTSDESSFTAGLPLEAQMPIADIGQDNMIDPALYYQPWMSTQVSPDISNKMHMHIGKNKEHNICGNSMDSMSWELVTQLSDPMDNLDWDTFIDDTT